MARRGWIIPALLIVGTAAPGWSQASPTVFTPTGPQVLMDAIEPSVRRWYVPQELHYEFGWNQWTYSNYARDLYQRYTDIALEGYSYYDIYGSYITRGWKIYDWEQSMPKDLGSSMYKSPKFSGWFNNLLISSASKGQYHMAITISDQIRTTLTPMTFSKPTFSGVQVDFMSDKYAATLLSSRISAPGTALATDVTPAEAHTDYTNIVGVRGVVQVGDFAELGGTYVSAHLGHTLNDWAEYSLKGRLSSWQNGSRVRTLIIRLTDDSPEDGDAGAMLFAEQIFIDGRPADIEPVIKGGIRRAGRYEANGNTELLLVYDISDWFYQNEKGMVRDFSWFEKVEFELILANDYKVEITSDVQVDDKGQEVFLVAARAPGNVKDASNQRVVRIKYGLPTGNEIYGLTLDLTDVAGFNVKAEYNMNNQYRRFPNPNPAIEDHALAKQQAEGGYINVYKVAYPWYLFGEAFTMDPEYSTRMYTSDRDGKVFYDDYRRWFEMVDDNDDQDRWPDWKRNPVNQRAGSDELRGVIALGGGVFPGLDENNDLISDFNQNQNLYPDYEEPFLRHMVDPPEYLFGADMNHNTVVDRFENDEEPDYPYPRDHRGYNMYVGVEMLPDVLEVTVGRLEEWVLSREKQSRSTYAMLVGEKSFPGVGVLRVFDNLALIEDDIPDDLVQWQQLPGTQAAMVPFSDPLACRNTVRNTAYADFDYTGVQGLELVMKGKWQLYHQLEDFSDLEGNSGFTGAIGKLQYGLEWRGIGLMPRLKTMFVDQGAFRTNDDDRREIWLIPSLIGDWHFLDNTMVEAGVEYARFSDLENSKESYDGFVYALQFTNGSPYMGYWVTSKAGYRQETRYFEDTHRTSSMIFLEVYAGLEQ